MKILKKPEPRFMRGRAIARDFRGFDVDVASGNRKGKPPVKLRKACWVNFLKSAARRQPLFNAQMPSFRPSRLA
jgi:hypothetical protein